MTFRFLRSKASMPLLGSRQATVALMVKKNVMMAPEQVRNASLFWRSFASYGGSSTTTYSAAARNNCSISRTALFSSSAASKKPATADVVVDRSKNNANATPASTCAVPPPRDSTEGTGVKGVEEEEEEEEMFVDPHESFAIRGREWGGPRRGGRFPEPTRYNDWERKGRCSDF